MRPGVWCGGSSGNTKVECPDSAQNQTLLPVGSRAAITGTYVRDGSRGGWGRPVTQYCGGEVTGLHRRTGHWSAVRARSTRRFP